MAPEAPSELRLLEYCEADAPQTLTPPATPHSDVPVAE